MNTTFRMPRSARPREESEAQRHLNVAASPGSLILFITLTHTNAQEEKFQKFLRIQLLRIKDSLRLLTSTKIKSTWPNLLLQQICLKHKAKLYLTSLKMYLFLIVNMYKIKWEKYEVDFVEHVCLSQILTVYIQLDRTVLGKKLRITVTLTPTLAGCLYNDHNNKETRRK